MSKQASVALLLAITACATLTSSGHASFAATSYVFGPTTGAVGVACASLGGSWDDSTTCTLSGNLSLGSGDSVLLYPGAVLAVPDGVTVADSGSIEIAGGTLTNAGTIAVSSVGVIDDNGTMTNGEEGMVTNSGTISALVANGTMTNDGSMINYPSGSLSIDHLHGSTYSGVYFINAGAFDNQGAFVSYGNLTNEAAASITNSGSFTMASAAPNTGKFSAPFTINAGTFANAYGGSVVEQGGTLNNTGTFTNDGAFSEAQGVYSIVNNVGTFVNNGTMTNAAFFSNAGGVLTNSGTMDNIVGCSIESCGTISNSGVFVNSAGGIVDNQGNIGNTNSNIRRPLLGTFTNNGTLINADYLLIGLGGTFDNSGNLTNSGITSNSGLVNNFGSIASSGTILNSGYIDNNSNASITNSRAITNTGSIDNLGAITNVCGGTIEGAGTVTGDAVETVNTCSTAVVQAPEFPAQESLPGLLLALILVVLAVQTVLRRSTEKKRLKDGR